MVNNVFLLLNQLTKERLPKNVSPLFNIDCEISFFVG